MQNAPITETHPLYTKLSKRYDLMRDVLQDEVKDKGMTYLPGTEGMKTASDPRYVKYLHRAMFPDISQQALTAMHGMVFERDPQGVSDEVVTNTGQTNVELARDVFRASGSYGRDVLLVESDSEAGNMPYITRYEAACLPNWKVNPRNITELWLCVFKEDELTDPDNIYSHESETVYRQYHRKGDEVEVSRWRIIKNEAGDESQELIDEPVILPVPFIPAVICGSIDLSPQPDPIPLLPVARCALDYYELSADYRYSLHVNGNPTPTFGGMSEEQYKDNCALGIGAGAAWYLGDGPEGRAGFAETSGTSHADHVIAMENKLTQAESYAVRLTRRDSTPESGLALAKRAAAQHASIYSLAKAVSMAVTRAQEIRAQWASIAEPEAFELDSKMDEDYAGEQMINALNAAVSAMNAPRSALFEAIRKAGLSTATNEEMETEIRRQGIEGGMMSIVGDRREGLNDDIADSAAAG